MFWGTTLWAPQLVYPLTSMACWTKPTTVIRALPALYRSPVTLQPWWTNISLKYLKRGRAVCMEIPCWVLLVFNFKNFPPAMSACFPHVKVVVLEIGNWAQWESAVMCHPCMESVQYVQTVVPLRGDGDGSIVHSRSNVFPFRQTGGF